MSTYLCMTSANSCVDSLNTEGIRDPASRLTQTADKRRERATPADRRAKAGKVEKAELKSRCSACSDCQSGRGIRTCQRERLAAETTPDKDSRFYSKCMRDKLTAEKEVPGLNVTATDMGNNRLFSCHCLFFSSVPSKPRCKNLMQAWLHWIYHQPRFQTLVP